MRAGLRAVDFRFHFREWGEGRGGGRKGEEKKEERRRKNLVDGTIKSRGSVKASCSSYLVYVERPLIFIFHQSSHTWEKVRVTLNARSEFLGIGNFWRVYRRYVLFIKHFSHRRGKFPWKKARGGGEKKKKKDILSFFQVWNLELEPLNFFNPLTNYCKIFKVFCRDVFAKCYLSSRMIRCNRVKILRSKPWTRVSSFRRIDSVLCLPARNGFHLTSM